ncbi:MAG TPA: metal ABC transporter ATP-binding protein [Alphaproteobacteria bacterium]|nr:metal ABC transporter ATP-binding protein [Alphaproteobacteria bacterium]
MQRAEHDDILLAGRGLTVTAGGHRILDHVDIEVRRGEIVTIVGLNGSGKTTLVRALLGLQAVGGGRVERRPGLRIGYVPQHLDRDPTLPLTVRRFLALGARAGTQEVAATLAEVGAAEMQDAQLIDLSGGELQRVLLARALLRRPDLLALDEPMSGVDVSGQLEIYRLIEGIRERRRCGILLVSHDLHVVMAATDRVVCLNHHVCCTGQPESVLEHPEFRQLFGDRAARVVGIYHHEHDHRHEPGGAVAPLPADRR